MARSRYGTGTILHSNASFSDPDDYSLPTDPKTRRTYLDPTTVTCVVRGPDGESTTYTYGTDAELIRVDQGRYRCDIGLMQRGSYRWTWTGATSTRAVVFYGEADAY